MQQLGFLGVVAERVLVEELLVALHRDLEVLVFERRGGLLVVLVGGEPALRTAPADGDQQQDRERCVAGHR